MSIPEFIKEMRQMGVEVTPEEVRAAVHACQEVEDRLDMVDLGRVCLFFAKIGQARQEEDLDVEKFDLVMGILAFIEEGD